ncbi:MAG: hypothetical protein ACTSXZ_02990, partial [Alphaproteobacteria bacterium]
GMDCNISLREMTAWCEKRFGAKVPVSIEPTPRKADHVVYITDTAKAEALLGWQPQVGLDEGLEEICAWAEKERDRLALLYGK